MTDLDKRIVKALQDGLPMVEQPFKAVACSLGISEEQLLHRLSDWQADGTIRRFGAVLRHHEAGFTVNAMGAWNVEEQQVERFAEAAAQLREVSHCYQRPRFEGFQYNVYTMIHGKSREECERIAGALSQETGVTDYALLYTTREYKKSSPVYFGDET